MKRVAVWIGMALALLVAGCEQRQGLETRVEAETPNDLFAWQARVAERLPESVVHEFNDSLARLVLCSPTKMKLTEPAMLHSKFHPICRELHGKTVREVIIAGYRTINAELLRRMILDSETLVVLLELPQGVEGTSVERRTVRKLVHQRTELVAAAKAQVEGNQRRIEELRATRPPERADFFGQFARWRLLTLLVP